MAEMLPGHLRLEQGKVRERVRQPRLAVAGGENIGPPHSELKVALVVAPGEKQMNMGEWPAVLAIENADGDGLVVNHREGLSGNAHLSSQQEQSGGERESKKSIHAFRL